jgi:hypothetical protein
MNKIPHIKILVLNWNGEDIIEKCLISLNRLDYKNFSIDVIDNNSTDNSIQIIKRKFPNVNLHINKKNLGYASGYNTIFRKLKNENFSYYFILNNDTVVDRSILGCLTKNLNDFGKDNIYGPKINYLNDKSKIWYAGGYFNKFLGFTKHIGINKHEKRIKYKTIQTKYISGCSMLISKNLINELDGFNSSFKMYYEDVDLCYRAALMNKKCFFIEDALVYHEVSYSIGRNSLKKFMTKIISQAKFVYYHNNIIYFIISLFINIIFLPLYLVNNFMKK